MFEVSDSELQGALLKVLGPYRPWGYHQTHFPGERYPEHSDRILDLKNGRATGLVYFADFIRSIIRGPAVVVPVPSHDPAKRTSGITALASMLAQGSIWEDGSGCLVRHTKIEKLAAGGNRSLTIQLGSMRVENVERIRGRAVILLDDVMTTGNSLLAGKQLLSEAGAASVHCLALGRTTY